MVLAAVAALTLSPTPTPTPTPAPWHSALKNTTDDVKTIVVNAGTIVVTAFGIVLITSNGKRIWVAATNAALTVNIPLIGTITLPARAAAQQQLAAPPPDAGLPPARPGPVGHGTAPQHLLDALSGLNALSAEVATTPPAQQTVALANKLAARPDLLRALSPEEPKTLAFYRRFYSALFQSQLRLLRSLAANEPVTVGDAGSIYRASRAFGQPLSFIQWLDFPRKYGMIESVDARNTTATIAITVRGREFVGWATSEGRGEGDLAAQGRSA